MAVNGKEALEMINAEKPALITLDLTLPGMDISELLQRLKDETDYQSYKICIISGRPELRSRSARLAANEIASPRVAQPCRS